MIALLKQEDFDPTDVDTDLHKRVSAAIQDGFINRYDMQVSSRDCDQDLSMWIREVEEDSGSARIMTLGFLQRS